MSGFAVVDLWLGYRMRDRAGKASSPLDAVRPAPWSFDGPLLELLWVVEAAVQRLPALDAVLAAVVAGPLFTGVDLPVVGGAERDGLSALVEPEDDEVLDLFAGA